MTRHLPRALGLCLALGLALAGCSQPVNQAQGYASPAITFPGASGPLASPAQAASAQPMGQGQGPAPASSPAYEPVGFGHWVEFRHVTEVVDLAGPRADGSFVVASNGRLLTMSSSGTLSPFAQGKGGYATKVGPEPYITLAGNYRPAGASCSFSSDTLYALQPEVPPGVISISASGQARRFANLPATGLADGIAFDSVGRFGHALLATVKSKTATTVVAIDCTGRVRTITTHAPVMEGGVAVAPATFGRYGGDLIGQNELTGQIFAIGPTGTTVTLAVSRLPHGPDTGVESAGFVPPGFGAGDSAYLADRLTVGNPHPGTDNVLRLPGSELISEGARPGDLLVASEGSAQTLLVRCASTCSLKYVAIGPSITHGEGHIVFTRPGG